MITNTPTVRAGTVAFFNSLRREWMRRCPDSPNECPVPAFESLTITDQQSFIRAMSSAQATMKVADADR